MLENFSERIKKKIFFKFKKKSPVPIPHRFKHSNKRDSNFLEIRCAHRWRNGDLSAISRSIVILRTKNRCLRTRLKINASQTIPRSSNLYIVEGHEWRGGKKKQSLKRELCPTLRATNGRQSLEHRRGRGTRRFPCPEKATMSKRRMQGFISYPQRRELGGRFSRKATING